MFELSKDHEDFRTVVREFAEAEVAPHVAAVGPRRTTSRPTSSPRWATSGCSASSCPEEFGGAATTATSPASCVAIEELGRVDQSIGITLRPGVGLGINPILTYGTEEQKERFLPDLVAGRALAALRPDRARRPARDAGATRTKARARDGDEWVVNGAKAFITNSGTDITSVVTVTARTGTNDDGSPQISAIMVPAGTPGLHRRAAPTTSSAGTPPTPTA